MRCRSLRNIVYLSLVWLVWILPGAAGLDAQQKTEAPRMGVVRFLIASSAFKDIDNAAVIRDLVVRSINASGKFTVVDTKEIDAFIEENNVSIPKLYSPEEMNKIPLTYVQFLVTGFISPESKGYRINMYMLDLSQKKFLFNENALVDNGKEDSIWFEVREFTQKFIEKMEYTLPANDSKTETLYRVWDTGPAGGIIFYAKSNRVDGWQYLEAAPTETEFRAVWG
ncbi:MAG: hypothetical protein LBB47_06825 [Spirochaetaceae bacterium]|jgi:hypothetical protein|nr:hypothetical protein [Spirochaetaceae bacterium]